MPVFTLKALKAQERRPKSSPSVSWQWNSQSHPTRISFRPALLNKTKSEYIKWKNVSKIEVKWNVSRPVNVFSPSDIQSAVWSSSTTGSMMSRHTEKTWLSQVFFFWWCACVQMIEKYLMHQKTQPFYFSRFYVFTHDNWCFLCLVALCEWLITGSWNVEQVKWDHQRLIEIYLMPICSTTILGQWNHRWVIYDSVWHQYTTKCLNFKNFNILVYASTKQSMHKVL